jgi:crotonobetainyl-CoA:carnitine CoA-transferase CaiB-like acyl-CoA transferase
MVVSTEEHPTVGSYKTLGNPVKTDEAEPESFAPAPLLGEDNRRVLVDLLGHSDEELAAWRRDGVV